MRRLHQAMSSGTLRRTLAILTLIGGAWLLGQGAWLQAKAVMAQWLIHDAWAETLKDGTPHRPWPWADHWPVARLVVPAHREDLLVLEGDSGAVLAFAPGHNANSGLPGSGSTVVVSGHRDTHFGFLKALQPGDRIQLRTRTHAQRYRVIEEQVVDSRTNQLRIDETAGTLLLVTCYPFEGLAAGGPLRYVVAARPEDDYESTPRRRSSSPSPLW